MNAIGTTPRATSPKEVQHLSEGMRTGYAILGIILIALAALVIASPFLSGYVFFATVWVFAVAALLLMGIADLTAATSQTEAPEGIRTLRMIFGVLIIIFAFIAAIDFQFAFVVVWIFVGLGLLFQAFYLLAGVGGSNMLPDWQRNAGVGLGVIELIMAFLVLLFPIFAFTLVWLLVSIGALMLAFHLLSTASSGVKRPLAPMMGVPGFSNPPMGGLGGAPPTNPPK
ncbi:MAG: hypothetical protein ACREBT_05145 [Thermoplasmata archaeon]